MKKILPFRNEWLPSSFCIWNDDAESLPYSLFLLYIIVLEKNIYINKRTLIYRCYENQNISFIYQTLLELLRL